jgi:hypothetical protein
MLYVRMTTTQVDLCSNELPPYCLLMASLSSFQTLVVLLYPDNSLQYKYKGIVTEPSFKQWTYDRHYEPTKMSECKPATSVICKNLPILVKCFVRVF